jgi:protein-S-isoprenylcysteine O-methyltransferase Ste14
MQKEKIFSRRHKNRDDLAGEHKLGDIGQLFLLFVFILTIIVDIHFLKISNNFSQLLSLWIRIPLGLIIIFIGGVFAMKGLKIVFSETREEPCVIREGVFKIVRHPIYLGSILTYLGFLVFSMSIIGVTVWLIIVLFYYFISIYEEKLLLQKFGDDYKEYMKEVPMWIPKLVKNNK